MWYNFQYPQSSSQVTCFLKSSQLFPPLPRPEKNLVSPSEFPPCNVPLIEHHPVLCRGQCLPPTKHPEPSPHSPFINRTQFYSDIHSSCMRLRDGDPILSIKGRSWLVCACHGYLVSGASDKVENGHMTWSWELRHEGTPAGTFVGGGGSMLSYKRDTGRNVFCSFYFIFWMWWCLMWWLERLQPYYL